MRLLVIAVCDSVSGRAALRWAAGRAFDLGADALLVTAVPSQVAVGSLSAGVISVGVPGTAATRAGVQLVERLVDEELPDRWMRPALSIVATEQNLRDAMVMEAKRADLVVFGVPHRRFAQMEVARCRRGVTCPVVTVEVDHIH